MNNNYNLRRHSLIVKPLTTPDGRDAGDLAGRIERLESKAASVKFMGSRRNPEPARLLKGVVIDRWREVSADDLLSAINASEISFDSEPDGESIDAASFAASDMMPKAMANAGKAMAEAMAKVSRDLQRDLDPQVGDVVIYSLGSAANLPGENGLHVISLHGIEAIVEIVRGEGAHA